MASFLDLPSDILFQISAFLLPHDLANVSIVCKQINRDIHQDLFILTEIIRDIPNTICVKSPIGDLAHTVFDNMMKVRVQPFAFYKNLEAFKFIDIHLKTSDDICTLSLFKSEKRFRITIIVDTCDHTQLYRLLRQCEANLQSICYIYIDDRNQINPLSDNDLQILRKFEGSLVKT